MILRVPDYYGDFSCIADKCKDSCCIGWEIDIDEDTHDYYQSVDGELQERFDKYMYRTGEGDYSFELREHGRCPFLNSTNLCDICIALGEEALSEVCTEYPRFAIEYGNVLQKCLSLSCEEVGRLVFTRDCSVSIVDLEQPDYEEEFCQEFDGEDDGQEVCDEEALKDELVMEDVADIDEAEVVENYEKLQNDLFAILQNQSKDIKDRIKEYLSVIENFDSQSEYNFSSEASKSQMASERFLIFEDMEVLNSEWTQARDELIAIMDLHNEASDDSKYEQILNEYLSSDDYRELDYEQLMVYFTFRYLMNSVYNFDHKSYGKLAIVFTLTIRDMAAVRYHTNGGHFTREDMIDVARIFSKEVEHSEDNVELAREAFLFDDVFRSELLIKQI